jgi:hypothetical protein
MGVTEWVRRALAELGTEASDAEVKAYIRGNAPTVPESQVSLALRKVRGKVVPAKSKQPQQEPNDSST